MPKNEDGEFELVLGNTQLLTMFFVVVVLLAVFFVMGYVVGRNSAPLVTADAARKPEAKPLVVDSPAPKPPAPEPTATPAPAAAASPAVTPAPAAVASPSPAPAPSAKTEAPKTEAPPKNEPPAKRDTKAVEKPEPAKAAKAAPAPAGAPPVEGGIYLQLSATGKADADKYVELLHKNGFPAVDKEVPEKLGTFRVLVGPIPPGDYNKVKADLQSKGLPGDKAFKQKF